MKPKRLISLLVAVCMMVAMLPFSAVPAFAADTSTVRTAIVDGYKYEYTINTEDDTATIKYFRGPVDSEGNVDSANNGPLRHRHTLRVGPPPCNRFGSIFIFRLCECFSLPPQLVPNWSQHSLRRHSTRRYFHRQSCLF